MLGGADPIEQHIDDRVHAAQKDGRERHRAAINRIVQLPRGCCFDRRVAVIDRRVTGFTHGCFPEIRSFSRTPVEVDAP